MATNTQNQFDRNDSRAALWIVLITIAVVALAYAIYSSYRQPGQFGVSSYVPDTGTTASTTTTSTGQ